MLVAWLAAALAADLAQGPLFIHHLVVLAPPLALLAGSAPALVLQALNRGGSPGRAMLAAVTVTATLLLVVLGLRAIGGPMPAVDPLVAPTIAAITASVPPGVSVVTDEPFSAAWTGHPVPPNLVDQSFARITTGELTAASVEADTDKFHARAVIFCTSRLKSLPGFKTWVAQHFRLVDDPGNGLQVWLRDHN